MKDIPPLSDWSLEALFGFACVCGAILFFAFVAFFMRERRKQIREWESQAGKRRNE